MIFNRNMHWTQHMQKYILQVFVFLAGVAVLFRGHETRTSAVGFQSLFRLAGSHRANLEGPSFARAFASTASERKGRNSSEVNCWIWNLFSLIMYISCILLVGSWNSAHYLSVSVSTANWLVIGVLEPNWNFYVVIARMSLSLYCLCSH